MKLVGRGVTTPPNKELKLTKPGATEAAQLNSSVRRTDWRMTVRRMGTRQLAIGGALVTLAVAGGCPVPPLPSDTDSCIKLLYSKDPNVRVHAAEQLGHNGEARATIPLLGALHDSDERVRGKVLEALGKIADPRALNPLIRALREEELLNRYVAAWALGHYVDPEAIAALKEALDDPHELIRTEAATALRNIGHRAAERSSAPR